jgi:Na+/H+-dicarboxylate symporter
LLYDDAKNGLEFAIARQGEEQAESSSRMAAAAHRLNVLVALFFPIATFGAIFNMSMRHGLEDFDARYGPWVMWALVGAALVLGIVITRIITRPVVRARERESGSMARSSIRE